MTSALPASSVSLISKLGHLQVYFQNPHAIRCNYLACTGFHVPIPVKENKSSFVVLGISYSVWNTALKDKVAYQMDTFLYKSSFVNKILTPKRNWKKFSSSLSLRLLPSLHSSLSRRSDVWANFPPLPGCRCRDWRLGFLYPLHHQFLESRLAIPL